MPRNNFTYKTWPRDKEGRPILNSTIDAIQYSKLIYDNCEAVEIVRKARDYSKKKFKKEFNKKPVNYQKALDAAVREQFYNECMTELFKIKDGKETAIDFLSKLDKGKIFLAIGEQ